MRTREVIGRVGLYINKYNNKNRLNMETEGSIYKLSGESLVAPLHSGRYSSRPSVDPLAQLL